MRIMKIEVYPYGELTDDAKERAHADYLSSGLEYFWADENKAVLDTFCEVFPIKVSDWVYGCCQTYINSQMQTGNADTEKVYYDLRGVRLLKYIVNNYWDVLFKRKYIGHLNVKEKFTPVYSRCQWENSCGLTGYCIDEAILQPLYEFLKRPDKTSSFEDILKDCLQSWIIACHKEYEACCEEEYFADHAEANSFEFTVNGELV